MKRTLLLIIVLVSFFLISCGAGTGENPPVIKAGVDPDKWVTVPAGDFFSGHHEHVTAVPYDYEIMVTDVTNKQYADFLNNAVKDGTIVLKEGSLLMNYHGDVFDGYKHEFEFPEGLYPMIPIGEPGVRIVLNGQTYSTSPEFADHPVTFVTWFGAYAYADYYGWRLPTEIEWEKAARGTDTRPFPWGEEIEFGNANYYVSHDPYEKIYGKNGTTTPVGFYNGSTYDGFETIDSPSPYGLYDVVGNVAQWTSDIYEDQHYRYLRGGSKERYGFDLRIWTRDSAGPEHYSPAIGFRCARDK